jgi:hypothetical protein
MSLQLTFTQEHAGGRKTTGGTVHDRTTDRSGGVDDVYGGGGETNFLEHYGPFDIHGIAL